MVDRSRIMDKAITRRGGDVQERPKYRKPITELQFKEQQEVMKWMADQILEKVNYVGDAGGDLDELLDGLSDELHIRRDDLYYGVQYAKESNSLSVSGNRVRKQAKE